MTDPITNITGVKPTHGNILVTVRTGTSKSQINSKFTEKYFHFNSSSDFRIGKSETTTVSISKTRHYRFDATTDLYYDNGFVDNATIKGSNTFLLNRIGALYPNDYHDPQSGIILTEVNANLPVNQQPRSSDYREKFMQYYEKNWGKPRYFTWDEVEIHHITPLKYGGSNATYNLIPLMKRGEPVKNGIIQHRTLTDWWNYY